MTGDVPSFSYGAEIDQTDHALLELAERASRSQSAIMAACGSDDRSLHVAIFGQALESQLADGSWGSDDTPSMKPCFTAQTIDMIWHLENKQGLDDTASLPTLMSTEQGPASGVLAEV